jgi:hypothetical protein
VQLVEYVGRSYEALVQLEGEDGGQLLVQSSQAPDAGSVIEFGVHPRRLLLFPYDEQGRSGGVSRHVPIQSTATAER